MTDERIERRLAAILAADVVGYSRLMGQNEERTLADLKSVRRTLVDPAIAAHRGRIVKTTGDGLLVEFASAVDAVRCAIEVQADMAARNGDLDRDVRLDFRVGVHVGDIIIDDNDIFGDGVNIAARLEGIAEPGAICISEDAHRQVRGKIDAAFHDLGPQALKNIAEPVRAWQIRVDGAPAAAQASAAPLPSLPDKPSIAVLPFQNMSGDSEQEYFADGMVEDIITALSRFKSLFVIARNSSFTYKGKAIDIRNVGRELGVRYVLEGSVRKAGNRVRITAQLIEAATNRHLWADKFDGGLEDVFDLQDQVTSAVVGLIAPRLEMAEIERARQKPTEKLDSYDHYLRGMTALYARSQSEAYAFFKKAIERDAGYAAAHAMLAWSLLVEQAVSGTPLSAESRDEAIQDARAAIRLADEDALALARAGHVLAYLGREYDLGASIVEQAVNINPNLAMAWYSRGWVTLLCADGASSVESFDRMLRLSPLDPLKLSAWNGTSFALFLLERYEEGRAAALRTVQQSADAHSLSALAANAICGGHTAEAQQAVARILRFNPDFRSAHARQAFPVRLPEERERIVTALREAGLPD
jgi:TolB-like protein/class 3 adenylate cyclase